MTDIPVWRHFAITPPPKDSAERVSVVIVGAGPVGLTLALDLAHKGHRVVVLNRLDCIPAGSKAICFSKRTLDIWQRLGVAAPMLAKGVTWNVGKVFWRTSPEPVFQFDLLPVKGQQMPAFINLQQYHVEEMLLSEIARRPNIEVRWGHCVDKVQPSSESVHVQVECNGGRYDIECAWLVACDGHRSTVRRELGLDFEGRIFEENFLIADIKMHEERPAERWFWFDPPFNPGKSALLHKQPDDVWRLDFQLGWNIDRHAELAEDKVRSRVRRMIGEDAAFELEWSSIYTFQCRRLERFVHDRVIFAGDSAHLVSPFGARGANGGIQDVDNLCWKLALVLKGAAPSGLLASYDVERGQAASENLRHSTRSTEFITPKTTVSRAFRNAVLSLAREHRFARAYVNSGRLSVPAVLRDSPLFDETAKDDAGLEPGAPAVDAPIARNGRRDWFLHTLRGEFTLITFGDAPGIAAGPLELPVPLDVVHVHRGTRADLADDAVLDVDGKLATALGASDGHCLLFRPDQHLAARWTHYSPDRVRMAVRRSIGH